MITPSRWLLGGKGLDDFRTKMLSSPNVRVLVDYLSSSDCFPGVSIEGGVSYFLWERDNPGDANITTINNGKKDTLTRPLLEKGMSTFIRFNKAISIIKKVLDYSKFEPFSNIVSSRKPFGLDSTFNDFNDHEEKNTYKIYANKKVGYVKKNLVLTNQNTIDRYKVFITYAYGIGDSFPSQVINKPFIGEPGSVSTETYISIGPFKNKKTAENVVSYMQTKFFRFLVLLLKNTQHGTAKVYSYAPIMDFDINYNDKFLYTHFNLNNNEIDFIESMVRPMNNTEDISLTIEEN
jgi:site-specific DNA-methyltransferase (adenine-specific)